MSMGTVELNIKNLLNERGLSESDLASIPDIGAEGVSKILGGKVSAIKLSSLASLCDALQCKPCDVLEYRP